MTGLLRVDLNRPDGVYVDELDEMVTALAGSPYALDVEQTRLNDGSAVIVTTTESEAQRLSDIGTINLPSGYMLTPQTTVSNQETLYVARLHDPAHGHAKATATTPEAAVETALRLLAHSWMHPNDLDKYDPITAPLFDGEIRRGTEVWWHNRAWGLLGTVTTVQDDEANGGDHQNEDYLSTK